jgi:hypothetical protein
MHKKVDFEEISTLIMKWNTICTLVALVTKLDWKVLPMDVRTTFPNNNMKNIFVFINLNILSCTRIQATKFQVLKGY